MEAKNFCDMVQWLLNHNLLAQGNQIGEVGTLPKK
jgi:hypothetical protein